MGGIVPDSVVIYKKQYCINWNYYCINGKIWLLAVQFQARITKMLIICVDFKVKTLSGDYRQLFFKKFLKFFTVNLKLFSLDHE